MRVLVTGMGGEIGTRVAQLLEARTEVTDILGIDFVPPRRRLQRAVFKRIDPREREKVVATVLDFAPQAVAHAAVYEPAARMSAHLAGVRTEAAAVAALGAAARAGALERVAIRSALDVYGRGPRHPRVPDERSIVAPTTPWGRSCVAVEALATELARRHGFSLAALRLAPMVGPHLPSPLGRVLRLPTVPVPTFSDPSFSLISLTDSAQAFVLTLLSGFEGPVNIVAPGSITPWQAARFGGRVPLPIIGPAWRLARAGAEFLGAPIPPHVLETLRLGRSGDATRMQQELGLTIEKSARDICAELFDWAAVVPMRPGVAA
ncbi:MAG: NAD-dependent epimerase/dehydratase family protein [Acidimicrobiia bacterium]